MKLFNNIITLCFFAACAPNFATLQSTVDLWERELHKEYQMAFEKRHYINIEELQALEAKTSNALQKNSIATRNLVTAQQHHHKLKSYLSYVEIADVLDESTIIKKNLAALVLDKLRQTPAGVIDPSQANDIFYRQAVTGELTATDSDDQAKQEFMRALLTEIVAMTEDTLRLQYYLFPFLADDFNDICRRTRHMDCAKFLPSAQTHSFPHSPFSTIEQVTERVNVATDNFNAVINTLNRLQRNKPNFIFQETNFEDEDVIKIYQFHELVLIDAMRDGVLPIMFADTFRQRSGNIWLKQNGVKGINNKLLTAVTSMTVVEALRETQENLLTSLQQLRKMQTDNKLPRDKKIYQWAVSNEVATARVIAQNPGHILVVAELLHKYQDKVRNPLLLFLDTAIINIELSCVVMIVPALASVAIPALGAFNLPRAIAFVGTLMNFPWIGMTQTKHIIARNRYLMLERSLLRGSSQRVTYSLKLLHEMQRLRKYAVISGTLGLAMSVPAMHYIVNHADVGFRNNLVDIVSSIFADYENFTYLMYETTVDMSENELETKPGH